MMRTEPVTTLGGRRLRVAPRRISASRGRGRSRRSMNDTFDLAEDFADDLAELPARRDAEGARVDAASPSRIVLDPFYRSILRQAKGLAHQQMVPLSYATARLLDA